MDRTLEDGSPAGFGDADRKLAAALS